ncbi:hypothetical protein HY624_00660 [Candidatus Uhrbacteria bacterium]|nr:hypothetical protein [Candidatus Uhrbacteria bacterium]
MEKHPLHLKNPELQTSPEVNRAVQRQEKRPVRRNEMLRARGQEGPLEEEIKIPNDPSERIEAYMDRLEHIFLHPDEQTRERNLDLFREQIYDALIIKKENFPESYFELQQRVARERGQPVEEIPEHVREQMMDVAINDQRASLDAWIEYFTSSDAVYPAWFKYFVWRNVTKLSQFDKEHGEFKKRTASTVAPYPDIYREPLAQIADIYEKVREDNKHLKEPEIKEAFSKKFPALYAELIQKSLAASLEHRAETEGEWVKYEHGRQGDAEKLYQSLENKGTGWCTAGQSTAAAQIDSGDFYVYYTNDASGQPQQPRIAIRMEGHHRIAEVRGILPHQGLEPIMQGVLDTKLQTFGTEADTYRKKSSDMKRVTALEQKRENEAPFTKDDLVFLYEINAPIDGFGYQKDPRVAELRQGRNVEDDMLVFFDCTKDEIAHVPSQISEHTKAYVGQLEPGVFQKLPTTIEHIYTRFPGRRIHQERLAIGGKTAKELKQEIEKRDMPMNEGARFMLRSKEFITSKTPDHCDLVVLTVSDLGFPNGATLETIYKRADELGLDLCPAEVGPQYRLAHPDQPMGDHIRIGMKPIAQPDGVPDVFGVESGAHFLWLRGYWAGPTFQWDGHYRFVFRRRPSTKAPHESKLHTG